MERIRLTLCLSVLALTGSGLAPATLLSFQAQSQPAIPSRGTPVMTGQDSSIRLEMYRPDLFSGVSRARDDFDGDGMPDLLIGFEEAGSGWVRLARGNVDYLFPNSPGAALRREEGTFLDQPFYPAGVRFQVPFRPELLVAGNFDADGHKDVVLAHGDDSLLFWSAGDGSGQFGPLRSIELPGFPTFVGSGEIGRCDGLEDLFVGVETADGSVMMIFQSAAGALQSPPLQVGVSGRVTAAVEVDINADSSFDLAVGAGSELIILGTLEQCTQSKAVLGSDSLRRSFDAEISDG